MMSLGLSWDYEEWPWDYEELTLGLWEATLGLVGEDSDWPRDASDGNLG